MRRLVCGHRRRGKGFRGAYDERERLEDCGEGWIRRGVEVIVRAMRMKRAYWIGGGGD